MRINDGEKKAEVMHPRLLFRYFVTTSDHLHISQSDQMINSNAILCAVQFARSNIISLLAKTFTFTAGAWKSEYHLI